MKKSKVVSLDWFLILLLLDEKLNSMSSVLPPLLFANVQSCRKYSYYFESKESKDNILKVVQCEFRGRFT